MSAVAIPAQAPADSSAPQLRTILLTDLCDSTQLVERLGDSAAAELFRQHDLLVLQLQQQWRGRLIDRSDGMLLLFERPIDGLGFALDYHRGLRELGRGHKIELKARAGLHVGEVLTWRNSEEAVKVGAKPLEVEGLAKPMAARLMTMARPGQVLVSAVAEPLAHRSARELGERGQQLLWKSYGRWRFKGLPNPQEVFEVGEAGIAPLRPPRTGPKAWRDIPLWRRPAALVAELAVVVGIGLGIWFVTKPQPAIAFNERDWVVVADLRNLTGQPVLDDSLEQAFRISLEQSRYVNVLSDLKARETLERMRLPPDTELTRAIASEIAIRDGARAVILPTVAEVGGHVRVSAEVIDPHSQTTVYSEYADGRGAESTLASIDDVTATLRAKLGEAMERIQKDSEPLPKVTTENLDALRAYALGQQATANRQWEEAKQLYGEALRLDPDFALAHMGLARILWSSLANAEALPHLERALELAASLPPRDRVYLAAWRAEVAEVGSPLDEWKTLAAMYPDDFAGLSNTSWYLLLDNQFAEALPYAKAAAVPQDPFRAFPMTHIGQILLAQGNAAGALHTFAQAEKLGGGRSLRYRADALAVLGRYGEAWAVLSSLQPQDGNPASLYVNIEKVSIAIDEGRFQSAAENANTALAQARGAGALHEQQFRLIQGWVEFLRQPDAVSRDYLDEVAADLRGQMAAVDGAVRGDVAYQLLALAYLGQRSGHDEFANEVVDRAASLIRSLDDPQLSQLLTLVEATRARLQGNPDMAIELLEQELDGSEMVQVHSALVAAYRDAGACDQALEHTNWLKQHRGRAYAEVNMNQLLQPINVADTRLAHLWAASCLVNLGQHEAATHEYAALSRSWATEELPDYLRRKLDVGEPASKQKITVNPPVDVSVELIASRAAAMSSLDAS